MIFRLKSQRIFSVFFFFFFWPIFVSTHRHCRSLSLYVWLYSLDCIHRCKLIIKFINKFSRQLWIRYDHIIYYLIELILKWIAISAHILESITRWTIGKPNIVVASFLPGFITMCQIEKNSNHFGWKSDFWC